MVAAASERTPHARKPSVWLVALVALAVFASFAFVQNQRVVVVAESALLSSAPVEVATAVQSTAAPVPVTNAAQTPLTETTRRWLEAVAEAGRRSIGPSRRTKLWMRRQRRAEHSIDEAIATKKREVAALRATNERLRKEQEAMARETTVPDRPSTTTTEERSSTPAAPAPLARPTTAAPKREVRRDESSGSGRSEDVPGVSRRSEAAAARKRRFVRMESGAGRCALVVPSGAGDDWMRCEKDVPETEILAMFEMVASTREAGAVELRSLGTGKYLEMVAPGEEYAWVVRAAKNAPDAGTAFVLEDGAYLRSAKTGGCVTVMRPDRADKANRVSDVRGHGNKPLNKQAGQKTPLSALHLRWLDAPAVRAAEAASAAARRTEAERARREAEAAKAAAARWANTTEKRVVAYGLYGADPKYTTGAIRNSELVHTVFPGWTARFYCRRDVPKAVLDTLRANGAEIVDMGDGQGKIAGMFWRFLAADDPTVDRFIVRDSDSRLNARERAAVEEWIASGKKVHTIRDHPNHDRPLNGGLWGGTKHCVPNMAKKIQTFSNKQSYGGDLVFLNTVVWPLVKNDQIAHDAYTCPKYPNSHPFPTKRPADYQHVGQVFSASDQPRMGDINGFMRGREIPLKCRKEPSWKFG